MDWIASIVTVLIGLLLIIAELVLVPGATVVGLLGLVLWLGGLVYAFLSFGATMGTAMLAASLALGGAGVLYSLKRKSWKLFSLDDKSEGKAIENPEDVEVGDQGKTISALRPMGTVEIGRFRGEVQSQEGWVEAGAEVRVTKIKGRKIWVEKI